MLPIFGEVDETCTWTLLVSIAGFEEEIIGIWGWVAAWYWGCGWYCGWDWIIKLFICWLGWTLYIWLNETLGLIWDFCWDWTDWGTLWTIGTIFWSGNWFTTLVCGKGWLGADLRMLLDCGL